MLCFFRFNSRHTNWYYNRIDIIINLQYYKMANKKLKIRYYYEKILITLDIFIGILILINFIILAISFISNL